MNNVPHPSKRPHLLVAYASEFGSTYEIAERIAALLQQSGALVDLTMIMDVARIDAYDSVVMGSAIFNGAWLPEAEAFVREFAPHLSHIPVAFFAVSMTMREDTPEHRRTVLAYLQPVLAAAPLVQPISIGLFAGRLQYRNLPLMTRVMFWLRTRLPDGDFRNWDEVDAWVKDIQPALCHHADIPG